MLLVLPLSVFNIASASNSSNYTDVGMWYSTWYAKKEVNTLAWITGYGDAGSNHFIGDVDGDGKGDAVIFRPDGAWKVGLSTGITFATPTTWRTGHGINSNNQLLGDVNGDGMDDAIVYFANTGNWYVSLSNGSGFLPYSLWISGHGVGSTHQLLGDVTGDGKLDAVTFNSVNGVWHVAPSTGTGFHNSAIWKSGFGISATKPFIADANADGIEDIAVFTGNTGIWELSISTGSSFGSDEIILNPFGIGSVEQFFVDGDNDGYADAYACFNGDVNGDGLSGDCYLRKYKSPDTFMVGGGYTDGIVSHSGFGANASKRFVSNVSGNEDGWKDTIAFYQNTGVWRVEPYRYFKKNIYDTWDAWNIDYIPYVNGTFQQYDSGNTSVIDEHIAEISAAGVDFLLFDQTNNVHVDEGYIWSRAIKVAERIKLWNENPNNRKLRYAIAVGGIQFSMNANTLEFEAQEVYDTFVNSPLGGDHYYHLDGKPLIVVYHGHGGRTIWENWSGDKSSSDNFTLRWADGQAQAGYYGWAVSNGTIVDSEVQVVMPGWNNRKGAPIVYRDNGDFYADEGWEIVLANKPEIVIINSYNEYGEQTAVAVTDTSQLSSGSEKWLNKQNVLDPSMYWDMTIQYIQQLN